MEKFDLFNDERVPLGKTIERGQQCGKGENRQVVHICIFNSKGEMLIQQRQSFKKNWADLWDISVGGCCVTGETSKQGASRELFEELGIRYDFNDNRPYFTVNFNNGFDDYYFVTKDINIEDLILQQEEVQDVKWATKEDIIALRKEGKFVPYIDGFLESLFVFRMQRGVILD